MSVAARVRRDPLRLVVVGLAVLLAVAGLVVGLWRPRAPALAPIPTDLDQFSAAVVAAVRDYRGPRYAWGLVSLALTLVVPALAVLTTRGRAAVARLAGGREHAPSRAALVAVVVTVAVALARLPIRFALGFVQDGRYGFRTSSLALWLRDWLVGVGIDVVVVAIAAVAVVAMMRRFPGLWHWLLVPAVTALTATLLLVYPVLVQPLFMSTVPLGPGTVRTEVEQVLAAAGESGLAIEVSDASRRTTRVNAFVTGIGPTRQVVLYDNLLDLPVEQVGIVVAHELAHREHRDLDRSVLLSAAGALPVALVLRRGWGSRWAARTMAARGHTDPRLMAVGMLLVAAITVVNLPVTNAFSRTAEAAADARAVRVTRDPATLIAVTRTFTVRDLSPPDPPGWVVWLWGTHPSVGERIRSAAAAADALGVELPPLARFETRERDILHPAIRGRE